MRTYQDNAFILIIQAKQTTQMHLKRQVLKKQKMNVKERGFLYLFLWGETGDNSDRTMNTQSNSYQRATGFIPNEPLS